MLSNDTMKLIDKKEVLVYIIVNGVEIMDWKLIVIFFVVSLILYVLYLFISQRQVAILSILLYQKQDYKEYYKQLNAFMSKLFFSRKLRTLMKLDAAFLSADDELVQQLVPIIDHYRLRPVERMIITAKELSYYMRQHQFDKAQEYNQQAKETFKKLVAKQKQKYQPLLEELQMSVSLVIDKSGRYAKELEKSAKTRKYDTTAGVLYLKASLAHYYRSENDLAISCLQKAYEKLKVTTYVNRIADILDHKKWSELEKLVMELS